MCFIESFVCFFCFKQKTAYELRISDWSSDVCSSDLGEAEIGIGDDVEPGHRRQRAVADHGDVLAAVVGEAAVAVGEFELGLVNEAARSCCRRGSRGAR